jgi:hypothetical protein
VLDAGGAGPGDEGHRRLAIVQVHRQGAVARQRERQVQATAAAAGRGGIDQHVETAQLTQVLPVAGVHAARFAQGVGQGVGLLARAVDDPQLADAGIEQGRRHAAGGAAGAEQQHAAAAQVQAMTLGQVVHQADAVGVVAVPAAVVTVQQGVDRAGTAGAGTGLGAQAQRQFLQRQGDAGTAAAAGGETRQELLELVRRRVDGRELQGHAELGGEGGVDARRQRMRHGVSEHGIAVRHVIPPSAIAPRPARNRSARHHSRHA